MIKERDAAWAAEKALQQYNANLDEAKVTGKSPIFGQSYNKFASAAARFVKMQSALNRLPFEAFPLGLL